MRLPAPISLHSAALPAGVTKPTEVAPHWPIDDGGLLNQIAARAPDAATRKTILIDNPARLYQF